jgi:hypothetical protein
MPNDSSASALILRVIADIKPPSIERLNSVLRLLKEENLEPQALQIQKAFFARMLALGKFEAANFTGLARALFQTNDAEKALKVLQIFVDAGGENGKKPHWRNSIRWKL